MQKHFRLSIDALNLLMQMVCLLVDKFKMLKERPAAYPFEKSHLTASGVLQELFPDFYGYGIYIIKRVCIFLLQTRGI